MFYSQKEWGKKQNMLIPLIILGLLFIIVPPVYAQNVTEQVARTVAEQTPIASDQDVNNTNATIAAAGTALAGGVATVFGKLQNDKKKINNALRRIDKEQKDAMDAMNLIIERAGLDINKDKTFYGLLNEQVIPGSGVNTLKLGQNWHQQYQEYVDWYEGRYTENKD
jgi:hypothetical protein